MAKKNQIVITDLGDAVNHLQAVVIYLNSNYKIMFRTLISALTIGLILGFSYLSNLQTVKIQKLEPIGANSSFASAFIATAQQKSVATLDSLDRLSVKGRFMGSVDKNYLIFKLKDRNVLVIINRSTGEAFQMELPELK